MSTSAYFSLSERLRHGISATLRWSSLRPVQELTIGAVQEGKNVVVLAPTAGGKTEAAFFPVLDALHLDPESGVGCIYISPLRALLNNQEGRVQKLVSLVGLAAFKWHGDVGAGPRNRFLRNPTEVLMTTPESLEVMLMSGREAEHGLFENLRFVVVDEVHAFAAGDRGAHLMAILERLQQRSDAELQRIGLSATVGDPVDLAAWMQGSSTRHWEIVDPPKEPKRRRIAIHHVGADLTDTAAAAAPLAHGRKSIFFTQGRADTERVREAFDRYNLPVFVHHSSVSREFREEAEAKFAETEGPATLVSTSTLELGIDVGDLDVILQLDAPQTVSSFLQRLGRTGRRPGTESHLEFFTSDALSLLQAVALVNLARRGFLENVTPSPANTPVFLHQMLAQVVEHTSVGREGLWRRLQGSSSFRAIDRRTFDQMVDHLIQTDILQPLDHHLALGEVGESTFGRRHFFELYSVFETALMVTVKTVDGQLVGTLDASFVSLKEGTEFVFLLAGRSWRAVEVDLDRGVIFAAPISGGQAPKWHGAGGFLGREIAEEMRSILLREELPRFVDAPGQDQLRCLSEEYRGFLAHDRCPLVFEGDKLRLYTFAGGRINATIGALLERSGIVSAKGVGDLDVDLVCPEGGMVDAKAAQAALRGMRCADEHLTESDRAELVTEKSRGNLAKFQPYLPPDLEGAFLAERLFDIAGTAEFARQAEFSVVSGGVRG